jgi:hypothetical protein
MYPKTILVTALTSPAKMSVSASAITVTFLAEKSEQNLSWDVGSLRERVSLVLHLWKVPGEEAGEEEAAGVL